MESTSCCVTIHIVHILYLFIITKQMVNNFCIHQQIGKIVAEGIGVIHVILDDKNR